VWDVLLQKIMKINIYAIDDYDNIHVTMGHAVAQWLRYCATNRKGAGLIPAGVTGIFH
jgi:hypothetical protein